jgi:hypothetical protein
MGFTIAECQTILDAQFPTTGAGDYVAWSTDGISEWAGLARTAVGATGWDAATADDPSIKANADALTSAAATQNGTISHFAVYSAAVAGTQRTDWQAVAAPRALLIGDAVSFAVGALEITLT